MRFPLPMVIFLAFLNQPLLADPRLSLDPEFGIRGQLVGRFGGISNHVLEAHAQPDGKVVIIGSADFGREGYYGFALMRVDSKGNLDPGFGSGGKVLTDFGGYASSSVTGAILKDGRIIVVGTRDDGEGGETTRLAMVLYRADGSLDESFGDGGRVVYRPKEVFRPFGVAIQDSGEGARLSVFGLFNYRDVRKRYPTRLSFDLKGALLERKNLRLGGVHEHVLTLRDGKTLLIGTSSREGGKLGKLLTVTRLLPDGEVDREFGLNGTVEDIYPGAMSNEIHSAVERTDGTVVLGGFAAFISGQENFPLLIALDSQGRFLPSWGDFGRWVKTSETHGGEVTSLSVDESGFVLAYGYQVQLGNLNNPAYATLSLYSPQGRLLEQVSARKTTPQGNDSPSSGVALPGGRYLGLVNLWGLPKFGCAQFFAADFEPRSP